MSDKSIKKAQGKRDRPEQSEASSFSKHLTYLLVGVGIGSIIGLLLAPKSGQELRGDIADATRKGIDRTRETATQIGSRAGEYYEVTRERAAELYSPVTDEAGKKAYRASELGGDETKEDYPSSA